MGKRKDKKQCTIADTLREIGKDVLNANTSINEVYITGSGRIYQNESDALAAVEYVKDKTIIKVTRDE